MKPQGNENLQGVAELPICKTKHIPEKNIFASEEQEKINCSRTVANFGTEIEVLP